MTMWATVPEMGIVDGPTEVHKIAVAKAVLRERQGSEELFPDYYYPNALERAQYKLADVLERKVGNL